MKTMLGKFAYTAIVTSSGYTLGRADYGTKGYSPVKGRSFKTWDEAKAAAKEMNDKEGISEREALEIVFNTMR